MQDDSNTSDTKLPREAARRVVVAVTETIAEMLFATADAFRDAPAPEAAEKFWANVAVGNADECWPWQGTLHGGYGTFSHGATSVRAHRFAYELGHGPVPDGHVVKHRCGQQTCQNPAHLVAVSIAEHIAGLSRLAVAARLERSRA